MKFCERRVAVSSPRILAGATPRLTTSYAGIHAIRDRLAESDIPVWRRVSLIQRVAHFAQDLLRQYWVVNRACKNDRSHHRGDFMDRVASNVAFF